MEVKFISKNGEPDQNFLPYVNGASQESLFYGEEGSLVKNFK